MLRRLCYLLCVSSLMLVGAGEAQTSLRVDWSVVGVPAGQTEMSREQLDQGLVQVTIDPAISDTRVALVCTNPATNERGGLQLVALGRQVDGQQQRYLFALKTVWGQFPYPMDARAVESKPMAIMAQRTGMSPFRMSMPDLRREFNVTAAYMLETAHHVYALPMGDGRLDCNFEAVSGTISGLSRELRVTFGRGLPDTVFPRQYQSPDTTTWRTWINLPESLVPKPDTTQALAQQLAMLLRYQAERTPEHIRAMRHWDDGSAVAPWIEITLDAQIVYQANPPRAARALSLVSVAMHDALVTAKRIDRASPRPAPCTLDTRVSPIGACLPYAQLSEHAIAAGAASEVLAYLYPKEASYYRGLADQAVQTRYRVGMEFPADIDQGFMLGKATAQRVIERAKHDNSDAIWDGRIPGDSGWKPTPPDFASNPIEPLVGQWQTWNLSKGSEFRPGPPPLPGSSQFERDLREVYDVTQHLDIQQQETASYWEDKKGSTTPGGHWNLIALKLVRAAGLDSLQAARIFATLNTAEYDAFVAVWDTKFTYWSVRPVTAVRSAIDTTWLPYIYTPPFPSYVSGHATVSMTAAEVLAHFFPEQTAPLHQWAEEAALSRIYGGIHFRTDNEVGQAMARKVAEKAITFIRPQQ